jgi:hypothetical protein
MNIVIQFWPDMASVCGLVKSKIYTVVKSLTLTHA